MKNCVEKDISKINGLENFGKVCSFQAPFIDWTTNYSELDVKAVGALI